MTRVLLADDHPLLLRGLADLVASEFELTAVTTSGIEALRQMKENPPDVAVLDLSMPDLDGLTILSLANEAGLKVRTVFLTAYISREQIAAAATARAWGIVMKETAPDMLLDCLRAVSAGARWTSFAEDPQGRTRTYQKRPHERRAEALTPRETEVVRLVRRGISNREIAQEIGTTEGTVKIHLRNIYQKLGVANRTALAALSFTSAL
jgi:DNA-binding NarL/FixJ family response regulator